MNMYVAWGGQILERASKPLLGSDKCWGLLMSYHGINKKRFKLIVDHKKKEAKKVNGGSE